MKFLSKEWFSYYFQAIFYIFFKSRYQCYVCLGFYCYFFLFMYLCYATNFFDNYSNFIDFIISESLVDYLINLEILCPDLVRRLVRAFYVNIPSIFFILAFQFLEYYFVEADKVLVVYIVR